MPTIRSLIDIITAAGETGGLVVCLDAAEAASYSGSGQTFTDRSGVGNDFKRGTTTGSDSADPAFNGSAGGLSDNEYFIFDGGDNLTIVGSNPLQSFHKNNGLVGILALVTLAQDGVNNICILGDHDATNDIGFSFRLNTSGNLIFRTGKGGASDFAATSTLTVPNGSAAIVGVFLDESVGANGGFFFVNGTVELFNSTYPAPSASNAAGVLAISGNAGGVTTARFQNGSRLNALSAWTRALTQGGAQAIYRELGLRPGLVKGGDATLSGDGTLTASGSAAAFGAAALSGDGALSCSGGTETPEEPEELDVAEPIYAVATVPVAAFEEPTAPEEEDLLRLNTSAVIDLAYLLELKPFAPAGTAFPV